MIDGVELVVVDRRRTCQRRTVTGCLTCRIRKVKCDEGKPHCSNCINSKRVCEGYPFARVPRRKKAASPLDIDPRKSSPQAVLAAAVAAGAAPATSSLSPQNGARPHRSLMPLPYSSTGEKQAFELFLSGASATSRQLAVPGFWRLVVQLSPTEPAIRHLALALGSLSRRTQVGISFQLDHPELEGQMMRHYGTALRDTRELISSSRHKKDIFTALMACVLFVWYETLTGNFAAAHVHMDRGMQIITSCAPHWERINMYKPDSFQANLQMVADCLNRVDLQLRMFADTSCPYPYEIKHLAFLDLAAFNDGFDSVDDALRTIIQLWQLVLHVSARSFRVFLGPPAADQSREIEDMKRHCQLALRRWRLAFDQLWHRAVPASENAESQTADSYGLLYCYYESSSMLLTRGTSGHEGDWDSCMPNFKKMISIVKDLEKPTLHISADQKKIPGFELGTVPVLFVLASKCRDPTIRREAIDLMHKIDRMEGLWSSRSVAMCAELVVAYEEDQATATTGKRPVSAADIPEHVRVCSVDVKIHYQSDQIILTFIADLHNPNGPKVIPNVVVPLNGSGSTAPGSFHRVKNGIVASDRKTKIWYLGMKSIENASPTVTPG